MKKRDSFQKRSRNSNSGRGHDSFQNNFSSFQSRPPREMHKATCAECGQECEVPFKPTEGRPVFCRDCFRKKQEDRY